MERSFLKVLLVILLTGAFTNVPAHGTQQVARTGIADLRDFNFHNKVVSLDGEWAFAWNELRSPGDEKIFQQYTAFPQTWNETLVNGKAITGQGYATYGLTVLLPKDRGQLALNIPDFYSSYRLFINGKIFAINGNPDS